MPEDMDPIRVTVLVLDGASLSSLAAAVDVFGGAGVTWNQIHGRPEEPRFRVELVTADGRPAVCSSGVVVTPHRAIKDVSETDLVVISALTGIPESPVVWRAVRWLRKQHDRGAQIAAPCTAAFVLAETGLLDGRRASTHWAQVAEFRDRFPRVKLAPDRIVVDEGDLYCSGGGTSTFDLCLYVVAKKCGREVAQGCAKALVHDAHRQSQAPYAALGFERRHRDDQIATAQRHLQREYRSAPSIPQLAKRVGMSQRSFERKFKAATGDTPLEYLQRVRVERAKHLLEDSSATFGQIASEVGYEDPSSFRRLFIRRTGLSPSVYRSRFAMRVPGPGVL